MRAICDTQLRLEFYQSNSKMSKKLTKIAEVLEKVSEDFKATKIFPVGAKGMTIEQGGE